MMTKVHNNFGTSGMSGFGENFKFKKKKMTMNDRVWPIGRKVFGNG